MAEIKNNFLQSKMNKDLDPKLVPNGQYIDASNILINKSPGGKVGTVRVIPGNTELGATVLDADLECIGYFIDESNNCIYRFLTNYFDEDPALITLPPAGSGYKMQITVYNLKENLHYTLVEGLFLNFATNKEHQITGVNLIEDLLFWVDNRNQPRKINVTLANPEFVANPTYYTLEEHISVAKYAPVDPISLVRKIETTVANLTSLDELELDSVDGVEVGMTIVGDNIDISDYATITSIAGNVVTLYQDYPVAVSVGDSVTILGSTMSDKSSDNTWPGDPAFLEDRYVRFSYRLRYDDGEYSIIAPFTQIAYVPKQKGYFINGDETAAFQSTIVRWMENNINNIELLIPLPDTGSNIANSYKISEIDVLYKESDSTVIKVLETIKTSAIEIASPDTNIFSYQYQAQKPYKALPENQTTRVYDNVPTRALAQEVSGNRIIYGNYTTTYTPPSFINYNTTVATKSKGNTNFIEYPNHTLKQNRNYQVGFVLADKFGRQSPVILSSVDVDTISAAPLTFGGSTVYSPYTSDTDNIPPRNWPGNALYVIVNDQIKSLRNIPNGIPGLYADPNRTAGEEPGFSVVLGSTIITDNSYTYDKDTTTVDAPSSVPSVGEYLRGQYKDYVLITSKQVVSNTITLFTDGRPNDIYESNASNTPDVKFAYTINPIGWYSYKIVVKQQEQDYYNVYLPGMLNGYPLQQTTGSQVTYSGSTPTLNNGINVTDFPTNEENKTAHIVLINDNINKVPRDLTEVGPDQKQYRSSVELHGRVENAYEAHEFEIAVAMSNSNVIDYDSISIDETLFEVGDAIWCSTTSTSADPWYWNTFITAVDTATKKITINNYNSADTIDDFKLIKGANKQYYPTRKADIVSSIANAVDFKFLPNTVDNIQGTAGLNLYQLQTNSLVGRVSTTSAIGISGTFMIPALSVYETKGVESLLDLFWETTTTGLISDLNYDVVNGFDGPADLNNFEALFLEWQNKSGSGTTTGAANSKYITDDIYPLNSSGTIAAITDARIDSVYAADDSQLPIVGKFDIVLSGTYKYRLIIKDNFEFLHDSRTKNLYTFKISFKYGDDWYPYEFTIPLRNIEPEITSATSIQIDGEAATTPATPFMTVTANNGSFTNSTTDLYWEIMSGAPAGYFSINNTDGGLYLSNPNIPLGVYPLLIKITDATVASNPIQQITPVDASNLNSLSNTVTVTVTVVKKPLNEGIRGYDSGKFVYQNAKASFIVKSNGYKLENTSRLDYPAGYGAIYIGTNNNWNTTATVFGETFYPGLPDYPGANGRPRFQSIHNVAIENGFAPTALTQGSARWIVSLNGFKNNLVSATQTWQFQKTHASFLLYYRATSTGKWTLANGQGVAMTDNRYDFSILPYNALGSSLMGYPGGNAWQQQSMFGRVWGNTLATGLGRWGIGTNYVTFRQFGLARPNEIPPAVSAFSSALTYHGGPDIYIQKNLNSYNFDQSSSMQQGNNQYYPNININQVPPNGRINELYQQPNGDGKVETVWDEYIGVVNNKNIYFNLNPTWQVSSDGGLYTTIFPNRYGWNGYSSSTIRRSTSFVTSQPGEYCLVVRMVDTSNVQYVDGSGIGPWLDVEIEDANFTYPGQIRTAYEYYTQMDTAGGNPGGIPSNAFDARGWNVSKPATLAATMTVLTEMELDQQTFNDFSPNIISSGLLLSGAGIVPGTEVTSVDYTNRTITISTPTTGLLTQGATFTLSNNPSGTSSPLWADTNYGTEVRQFFTDNTLLTPWNPPVPDKFYTFRNKTRNYQNGSYDTGGTSPTMPSVTNKPNFCALFDADGKVVLQTGNVIAPTSTDTSPTAETLAMGKLPHYAPNVLTAWTNYDNGTNPLNNFHENVWQTITIT